MTSNLDSIQDSYFDETSNPNFFSENEPNNKSNLVETISQGNNGLNEDKPSNLFIPEQNNVGFTNERTESFNNNESENKNNKNKKGKLKKKKIVKSYNIYRKIIHDCNKSITNSLNKEIRYIGGKEMKNPPSIERHLKFNFEKYHKFFKRKYKRIIQKNLPKRYKGQKKKDKKIQIERNKGKDEAKEKIYRANKSELKEILDLERNNPIIEVKTVNKLIRLNFGDYLKAYLNDDNFIIKLSNTGTKIEFYFLEDFQTLKDNKDEEVKKEKYKNILLSILNG